MGKSIAVLLIRTYQTLTFWVPGTCRYSPSCSNYTLQAIQKYGALKGIVMGAKRIWRCRYPYGGHDPVP